MKKEQTIKKKNNGSKNNWHMKKTSSKSYMQGLWYEDICIPCNVQCDMCDGAFFVLFDMIHLCFISITVIFL